MYHDTRPAALDSSGSHDAWAEFRVDDPAELLRLLQQLRDTSAPLMLSVSFMCAFICALRSMPSRAMVRRRSPSLRAIK